MSDKPTYEIVSPVGQPADARSGASSPAGQIRPAAPLADLNGKRIGLVWTFFTNGNVLLEAFADLLKQRFPRAEFVKLPTGRTLNWGDYPDRTLTDFARESGLDAAIVAPAC